MADQWYYRKDGETRGPLSRQELAQLARAGEINAATLVWRSGFSDWISYAALGAADKAPAPPPPPISPPSPKQAVLPRSVRQPPADPTRWVVLGAAGVLALLAAGAIGWFARGMTLAPRDGLNVAAKPASPPVSPAENRSSSSTPSARVAAAAKPEARTSPMVEDSPPAPPRSSDLPQAASPPAIEPPIGSPASATPAAPTPPVAAAPPEQPASPPATAAQEPPMAKTQVLYQEVDVERIPKFSILGTETVQHLQYLILSELRVGPADERGVRQVEQCVNSARLIKADDLSRGMFEESLKKLVGWQFSYRLNAGGEVLELASGPADGRRAERVAPMGASGFLLTSVMDESGWKELAQLSFFVPDEQTRGNQPSVRQMTHDFGPLGSWSGTTQFRRQGTQKGVLRIDYVHDMTYKPPEKGAGGLPFAIGEAKFVPELAGGTIYFDTKAGRVQAAQDRFQVRGEISADVLGQAAAIQVQEQQAITVRLFDQDPWQQSANSAGSGGRMP